MNIKSHVSEISSHLNSSWYQSGSGHHRRRRRPPSAASGHRSPPPTTVCRTPVAEISPDFFFGGQNGYFLSCFFIFWNPNHCNYQAQLEKLFVVVCFNWVVVSWSRVPWPPREKRQCCSKRQETWMGEGRLPTMCCSVAIGRVRCFGNSQIF